jgi:hypothetical protein
MNIYDTLKYKKFYKNRFFGFNFSTGSKVALINFINIASKKDSDIDYHVNEFVDTYGINYMLIGGGDDINPNPSLEKFNTLNTDGIKGFDQWSDFGVLHNYINEIRNLNGIQYLIYRGNCGSAWTALKVAEKTKVESIMLTTPAFTLGELSDQGFDPAEVHAIEYRQFYKSKVNSIEELDTFPILLGLKDQGIKIDLHWTNRLDLPELPRGEKRSDHYELQRAKNINPKRNLKVHLHDLPLKWHSHNLHRYLVSCGTIHRLIKQEVHLANIYLNNLNSKAA